MHQWLSVLLGGLAVLKRSFALRGYDFLMFADLDVGLVVKKFAGVGFVEETDDQASNNSEEQTEAQ